MKEIFCNKRVVQGFDQARHELQLKEELTGQSITIGDIPDDAILLKLDVDKKEYKVRSAYLRSGQKFIHKGCDYCLILPSSGLALLFELKSNNPRGYADQFVASQIFIEYCVNLWNSFHCDAISLSFKRVLLSPKYNRTFTGQKTLHQLTPPDKCGNEVACISPGFPERLRLSKIIK